MKVALILLSLLIAGCSEHYRYPCQDPANWNSPECQRPVCEPEGICPDQLTGQEIDLTQGKIEAAEQTETVQSAPCEQPTSEEVTGE